MLFNGVNFGVHQGSVLSPLLFILVLEALFRELRTGVPWELLYADDLVLISESLDDCISKFEKWKLEIESKGLRVNSKKTKFMLLGSKNLRDSGAFPCSVRHKGVGVNSVFCSTCSHWVHKRCSGLTGRMKDQAYVCPRCLNLAPPLDYRPIKEVIVGNATMDVEPKFCYLGDMLCADGGCELAVITRCSVAWGKFKKLLPILTSKHIPLELRGKLYRPCVRSALLYGSENWAPTVAVLQRLDMWR